MLLPPILTTFAQGKSGEIGRVVVALHRDASLSESLTSRWPSRQMESSMRWIPTHPVEIVKTASSNRWASTRSRRANRTGARCRRPLKARSVSSCIAEVAEEPCAARVAVENWRGRFRRLQLAEPVLAMVDAGGYEMLCGTSRLVCVAADR